MAELTPRLAAVFQQYFSDKEDLDAACWLHKQSGKYLAKHWALKMIARKTGMKLAEPVHILPGAEPSIVVFFQRGTVTHEGREYEAHAYGHADGDNNKNRYHYAMAQKRGEDQVIVDLLEQIQGVALRKDLYGDEEADWDGKPVEPARTKTARVREMDANKEDFDKEADAFAARVAGNPLDEWRERILGCTTRAELEALYNDELLPNVERFSKKENKELMDMFALHGKSLK